MAVNSDRTSHRTKPPLSVHTSDQSGGSRGRNAQTPAQIPATGWRDVAMRVVHGISKDRITTISGGVTFFVLLALFPGLAGLISLYGLVADSSTIGQHLSNLFPAVILTFLDLNNGLQLGSRPVGSAVFRFGFDNVVDSHNLGLLRCARLSA